MLRDRTARVRAKLLSLGVLVFSPLLRRPFAFPIAMKCAIYGYHFRKVAEKYIGKTIGIRRTENSVS